MTTSSDSNDWKDIAARKQKYRASCIPQEWRIPSDKLPRDPPQPEYGPQNVLDLPLQFLNDHEISITESHSVEFLLSAISTKKLSAYDVASAFSHRAAIAHQLTNCLTEPLFDSALKRAKELDEYQSKHKMLFGPLHGLPVSVKDGFNITGVDSSIGIASLCFKPATSNAPLVDLLLALGCVIVAKTNVPQTLASLDSINNIFGRTMNPINRLLTAGGSSGGEGVIVAMKGSMVGFGTDIGGSIRIPAMCNGVYGFKPSTGRLPYSGQQMTAAEGISRSSVQASAGPLARSIADINFVMAQLIPRAKLYSADCFDCPWDTAHVTTSNTGSGPDGKYTIGILHSDNNCQLLPPIRNLMTEIRGALLPNPQIHIIDLPTPTAWTKSQSVMSKLMSVEGGNYMSALLTATSEPLVPWMSTRFRTGAAASLSQLAAIQSQRYDLESAIREHLWTTTDPTTGIKTRKCDAVICPLAPHPVPQIDSYNAVGYTSSWVLFDMPAGTVPVRAVAVRDIEVGVHVDSSPSPSPSLNSTPKKNPDGSISSWDARCRSDLWDEKNVDRRVYLGSPLCVQVVVPSREDGELMRAMRIVDGVLNGGNRTATEEAVVEEVKGRKGGEKL